MFIHWVTSFRVSLTDVQNNSVFISLFKSFQKSAEPSGRSIKGTVQLSLISGIYTVTTKNWRPRHLFIHRILQWIVEPIAGVTSRSQGLGGTGHRSPRVTFSDGEAVGILPLSPQFPLCNIGAVLLSEASRVMAGFLLENKIVLNQKYPRKSRSHAFCHSNSWAYWRQKAWAAEHPAAVIGQPLACVQEPGTFFWLSVTRTYALIFPRGTRAPTKHWIAVSPPIESTSYAFVDWLNFWSVWVEVHVCVSYMRLMSPFSFKVGMSSVVSRFYQAT